MPQELKPPRPPKSGPIDLLTVVAFFAAFYLLVAAVFTFGVAESEDRIGCALRGIMDGLVVDPRACPAR